MHSLPDVCPEAECDAEIRETRAETATNVGLRNKTVELDVLVCADGHEVAR